MFLPCLIFACTWAGVAWLSGPPQRLPARMSDEVEENGVRINIRGTCHAPKKNEVMYNSEMLVNR